MKNRSLSLTFMSVGRGYGVGKQSIYSTGGGVMLISSNKELVVDIAGGSVRGRNIA